MLGIFLIGIQMFLDCGACISEQDYALMRKIKQHLKKQGDSIKVSEIHGGDWKEVCTSGYGVNMEFTHRAQNGVNLPDRVVLNGALPYITDRYDESAIVFYYGDNGDSIEVYRMIPQKMIYQAGRGCFSREEAYLQVRRDKSQFSKNIYVYKTLPDDYIEITIVPKKEIEND